VGWLAGCLFLSSVAAGWVAGWLAGRALQHGGLRCTSPHTLSWLVSWLSERVLSVVLQLDGWAGWLDALVSQHAGLPSNRQAAWLFA
jgi:hypothetical protein